MDAVIEINVIGKIVHSDPFDRFVVSQTFTDRLEDGSLGPDLGMTVHARLRRRNACERGLLDRSVAIAAIDPESFDVMFVAERNRLSARDISLCDVRGAVDLEDEPPESRNEKQEPEDADPSNRVGAAMKDLRHVLCRPRWRRDPNDV
jgi:hypothetical protein